jgi:broad specificity phosphatase PhoE
MNKIENIFLIRHARSLRNEGLAADEPDCNVRLSDAGLVQAAEAGKFLSGFLDARGIPAKSLRLWTSPYARTRETRDIMMPHIERHVMDSREDILLTEWNFGLFDGLEMDERHEKYPVEAEHYDQSVAKHGKFYARPLNGESWQDVCVRVRQLFGTIVRDSEKQSRPVRNIAVISHGLALRAFVMMWMHHPVEWLMSEPNPNNASIRRISKDSSGRFVDNGYVFGGFEKSR